MANPSVLTTFGSPDPNAAPLNISELVDLLNTLVVTEIQGDYIPYVMGANTPSVDDQDKAWIEKDSSGRPKALKIFYGGNWRRVYNGMIGEVRGYTGDPTTDFDTDGLGLVGGIYDGWHLMNGNGGTADWSDKFIAIGHMNEASGYSSGWLTKVNDVDLVASGGTKDVTIAEVNLPPLDVTLHGFEAKEAVDHSPSVVPLVDTHYANDMPHDLTVAHYGAATGGAATAIPSTPPFLVMALITFVGYL